MKDKKYRSNNNLGDRAIVIGGSIAGLLNARILADYFNSVTIIEKDKLPEQPNPRKGVPQSVQPHILFARGYRILEELFPGIGIELTQRGALKIDWAKEFYHFEETGWGAIASVPSDIISFTCSRPLLEWTIRDKLSAFSNVQFLEEHRVNGLLSDSLKNRIVGVRLTAVVDANENKLTAELVVDANRLRQYEQINLPNGFVVVGDAVCALCPVYGQGMTVSALAAITLQDCLKNSRGGLVSSNFQKKLAKSNSLSWSLATAQDLRFPTTKGEVIKANWFGKMMQWYNRRLFEKASSEPSLHTLFIEVSQLLKSPLAFYHPSVVFKILFG